MYKMIIFRKGTDSNNLQYDDILGVHNNITESSINDYINKFIDNGYSTFADYKFVKIENN